MKLKPVIINIFASLSFFYFNASGSYIHDIIFCGESIPVHNDFVAAKLMNVIRWQIPNVNLPQLRRRIELNFPVVERYLHETGLPEDFKYLAIVESGFQNLTSSAGARGFWQLMPETARELGLVVSPSIDERDNIYKATYAACKVLASYYLKLKKTYGVSSWTLTAAAYNFGIGNISNAINRQGNDYFSMNLNKETALYIYKIIALKELFEYPELYIKDFGYNVFSVIKNNLTGNMPLTDSSAFSSMTVNVNTKDGNHPDNIIVKEADKQAATKEKKEIVLNRTEFRYLAATIKGKYSDFEDGKLITLELLENLQINGNFNRKGTLIKGKGWIIGERIFIDLGFGSHDLTLLDVNGEKGIDIIELKNNTPVLLKSKSDN